MGSRVRYEEGQRTHRPERSGYNNEDEENSPNIPSDKNYQVSSKKFRRINFLRGLVAHPFQFQIYNQLQISVVLYIMYLEGNIKSVPFTVVTWSMKPWFSSELQNTKQSKARVMCQRRTWRNRDLQNSNKTLPMPLWRKMQLWKSVYIKYSRYVKDSVWLASGRYFLTWQIHRWWKSMSLILSSV